MLRLRGAHPGKCHSPHSSKRLQACGRPYPCPGTIPLPKGVLRILPTPHTNTSTQRSTQAHTWDKLLARLPQLEATSCQHPPRNSPHFLCRTLGEPPPPPPAAGAGPVCTRRSAEHSSGHPLATVPGLVRYAATCVKKQGPPARARSEGAGLQRGRAEATCCRGRPATATGLAAPSPGSDQQRKVP
jgi:hypothetical protein